VVPEVEAWRRKAGRDKRWRKAVAVLITAPFVVSGVMTLAVALAVANPVAAGVGLLLTVFGTLLIAYELQQARCEAPPMRGQRAILNGAGGESYGNAEAT
jgi:hypothetical protein